MSLLFISKDLLGDIITGMPNISLYHMDSDNFQPRRVSVFNEPIDSISDQRKKRHYLPTDGGVFSCAQQVETGILNNSFDAGGFSQWGGSSWSCSRAR